MLRLGADAPAEQTHFTPDEAAQLPATLFIGVEIASSPLATINTLGPRVVISDFGNNNGLILGPEVTDWLRRADCERPTHLRSVVRLSADVRSSAVISLPRAMPPVSMTSKWDSVP